MEGRITRRRSLGISLIKGNAINLLENTENDFNSFNCLAKRRKSCSSQKLNLLEANGLVTKDLNTQPEEISSIIEQVVTQTTSFGSYDHLAVSNDFNSYPDPIFFHYDETVSDSAISSKESLEEPQESAAPLSTRIESNDLCDADADVLPAAPSISKKRGGRRASITVSKKSKASPADSAELLETPSELKRMSVKVEEEPAVELVEEVTLDLPIACRRSRRKSVLHFSVANLLSGSSSPPSNAVKPAFKKARTSEEKASEIPSATTATAVTEQETSPALEESLSIAAAGAIATETLDEVNQSVDTNSLASQVNAELPTEVTGTTNMADLSMFQQRDTDEWESAPVESEAVVKVSAPSADHMENQDINDNDDEEANEANEANDPEEAHATAAAAVTVWPGTEGWTEQELADAVRARKRKERTLRRRRKPRVLTGTLRKVFKPEGAEETGGMSISGVVHSAEVSAEGSADGTVELFVNGRSSEAQDFPSFAAADESEGSSDVPDESSAVCTTSEEKEVLSVAVILETAVDANGVPVHDTSEMKPETSEETVEETVKPVTEAKEVTAEAVEVAVQGAELVPPFSSVPPETETSELSVMVQQQLEDSSAVSRAKRSRRKSVLSESSSSTAITRRSPRLSVMFPGAAGGAFTGSLLTESPEKNSQIPEKSVQSDEGRESEVMDVRTEEEQSGSSHKITYSSTTVSEEPAAQISPTPSAEEVQEVEMSSDLTDSTEPADGTPDGVTVEISSDPRSMEQVITVNANIAPEPERNEFSSDLAQNEKTDDSIHSLMIQMMAATPSPKGATGSAAATSTGSSSGGGSGGGRAKYRGRSYGGRRKSLMSGGSKGSGSSGMKGMGLSVPLYTVEEEEEGEVQEESEKVSHNEPTGEVDSRSGGDAVDLSSGGVNLSEDFGNRAAHLSQDSVTDSCEDDVPTDTAVMSVTLSVDDAVELTEVPTTSELVPEGEMTVETIELEVQTELGTSIDDVTIIGSICANIDEIITSREVFSNPFAALVDVPVSNREHDGSRGALDETTDDTMVMAVDEPSEEETAIEVTTSAATVVPAVSVEAPTRRSKRVVSKLPAIPETAPLVVSSSSSSSTPTRRRTASTANSDTASKPKAAAPKSSPKRSTKKKAEVEEEEFDLTGHVEFEEITASNTLTNGSLGLLEVEEAVPATPVTLQRAPDSILRSAAKKSVIFGSPDAVEFLKTKPTTNLTPLSRSQSKLLFSMEMKAERTVLN